MSWAKVKKINSDMTTPIDVLLKNSTYLVASNDRTLFPLFSKEIELGENSTQIGEEFRMNMTGTIRVCFTGKAVSANFTLEFSLNITRNGIYERHTVLGIKHDEVEDVWVDIFVNKGDVISLSVSESRTYSQYLYKGSINGSIVFSPIGEPIVSTN